MSDYTKFNESDAYIAASGVSFGEEAIKKHVTSGITKDKCPVSEDPISPELIFPNLALRHLIQ